MEKEKVELALYVINLKIAKEIKENKEKDYEIFSEKIKKLKEEKNEIYKYNEKVINEVINQYLNEVKISES